MCYLNHNGLTLFLSQSPLNCCIFCPMSSLAMPTVSRMNSRPSSVAAQKLNFHKIEFSFYYSLEESKKKYSNDIAKQKYAYLRIVKSCSIVKIVKNKKKVSARGKNSKKEKWKRKKDIPSLWRIIKFSWG